LIRRILRRLILGSSAALMVMIVLAAALLLEPQWFLTSRAVARAVKVFGRAYRPEWSRFDFQIRSTDVFAKEAALSAGDFCFANGDGSVSGCFKRLELRVDVALSRSGVRVVRLDRLDALGGRLRLDRSRLPAAAPRPTKPGVDAFHLPSMIPASLSGLSWGPVLVDLSSLDVIEKDGRTKASGRLAFDPKRADPLNLDARWSSRSGRGRSRGRARVDVASDFFRTGRLTRASARGVLEAADAIVRFSAKARQSGADAIALETSAEGASGGMKFRVQAQGTQTAARCALAGDASVDLSSGPLSGLRLENIRLTASRRPGASLPESLRLEAKLRAEPVGLRPLRGFTPPRFLTGKLVLNARTRGKDRFDADVSLVLNPYLSWYEAHADLYARASGQVGQWSKARVEQRLDADLSIPRFEDLAAFLAGGPLAVPAPLDALKGTLRAELSARGRPGSNRIDFDAKAGGDLSGGRQKLRFHVAAGGAASGPASGRPAVRADVAATLEDVAVQLPHLDALRMPKLSLDPRIKSAAAKPPEASASAPSSTSAVVLDLTLGTTRPILLYTDLAKSPVPVALDLRLKSPPGLASGVVALKSFDVEFFRRRAVVDHLTLTLRPGSKAAELDGLVKYKADEALISIRLLGSTEKPRVVFESDPPLSQNEIVALLLFGKSPDELDADQAASVANAQTAMSDKAFGLASLYLFASTPIQFVGYDPASKSYTMKFRIPGGETLALSSDFDATRTVQLRRRLSRHFAVAAEAVNSQTRGNGVVTFLEWFTRY
jgi:hypothetical protein